MGDAYEALGPVPDNIPDAPPEPPMIPMVPPAEPTQQPTSTALSATPSGPQVEGLPLRDDGLSFGSTIKDKTKEEKDDNSKKEDVDKTAILMEEKSKTKKKGKSMEKSMEKFKETKKRSKMAEKRCTWFVVIALGAMVTLCGVVSMVILMVNHFML